MRSFSIGGHLDSWDLGTGATDDGAGMAIVFGAARLIAGLPQRPGRTIRVVLFGAEEMNFSGAAYAQAHEGEAGKIVVAGEADFGARNVYAVQLPGGAAGSDFGHTLERVIAPLGANLDRRPAPWAAETTSANYRKPACRWYRCARMDWIISTPITPPTTRSTRSIPGNSTRRSRYGRP